RPLEAEKFVVDMIDQETGKVRKIEMARHRKKGTSKDGAEQSPAIKGEYVAEVMLKRLGTFELTAYRDDPAYENLVSVKTIRVALPEEERRHPEANPAKLQSMAPGKQFVMIHQADELARRVPTGKLTLYDDIPRDLWDVPLAVVLIVTLLGVEWLARKRYNMA
ncbi:hypothetical protein LCGC14_2379420, partial [marine sediment metagenome]